jgi:nucleoid-associated protein YgaU
MKKAAISALLMMIIALFSTVSAQNWQYQNNAEEYDTMSLETYQLELTNAQQRETELKTQIANEQAIIDSLKARLVDLDAQIASTIADIYRILGITEDDVLAAEAEIREIRQNLELLLGLPSDELLRRSKEIAENEARINALKEKPVSYLWKIRDQIRDLESLLAQVKANLPDQIMSYEVQLNVGNRDCLYRIAGRSEVYEDASRWPEIYRANKAQIDRSYNSYKKNAAEVKYDRPQDLIFPGQVFDIPR